MKYIKIILIIAALLNNSNTNAQEANASHEIVADQNNYLLEESAEKIKKEELTDMQKWNEHLELLTIKGEYWDVADSVPTDSWQREAFDLAQKIVKKDKNIAEQLKTTFFDAIKTKIALEKGELTKETTKLISEFDKMIEDTTKEPEPVEVKETPFTTPIITEDTSSTIEPIIEPLIVPAETSTNTINTTTSSSNESTTSKSLKDEWQDTLKAIEQDEDGMAAIDKAHAITSKLFLSGQVNPQDLEFQFNKALNSRMKKKGLDPSIVDRERAYFRMNIAQQLQPIGLKDQLHYKSSYPSFNEEQKYMLEKQSKIDLQEPQKDAKAQEKLEKQRQKDEEKSIKLLAAASKAAKEDIISKEQLRQAHYLAQLQKEREAEIARIHKEEIEKLKNAQEALSQNIQQIAQAQQAAAQKGMFSAFTEAVGNWWSGQETPQPKELSATEQEKFLDTMVEKTKDPQEAKKVFKYFQYLLLNFSIPQFWDEEREVPNRMWIRYMQESIKNIVITYEIMDLTQISEIVKNVFESSKKISGRNIEKTIQAIQQATKEEVAKQKEAELKTKEIAQQRKEKKEKIIMTQQKEKEAQAKIEAEKQKHLSMIAQYKSEKDGWYDILYNVASNKHATQQSNHNYTQKALEKSESLLQLAGNIPAKNKIALSQKLKQKFSVALLEQQKRNNHDLNIYHHMDAFNSSINKMIE